MKKFREKTKNMRKGLISFVLALSIVIQTLVVGMVAATLAAAVDETPAPGGTSATVNNVYTESGIAYITKKELTYQGDRTFNLSLTATSSLREAHQTSIRTSSEDGYFTASAQGQGYYLLELYGGDGGYGATTSRGGDGEGGQGGYAYGYIWLDPGDTLVYTIGTIGDSTVYAGEDGSGENNEDAGHGDNGSYAVGAGGGYSAIYLIRGENGESKYEKPDNGLISADDRLTKYIMIAGGGGGGGAGNGALELSTGNANGGAGGTVASGAGIHLTSDENAANGGVAGTYYSGSNGETSGHKYWAGFWYIDDTTYKYVGIGGTNVPGQPNKDAWDLFDWTSTDPAQYWYQGGAGGPGNFRGGGGGAGFAGGSGGIMEGALLTKNIGGGGGGSSFIADAVTVFDPNEVDEDLSQLLLGPGGNDNETGSGGKAIITFVGADPTTKAYTKHLADVKIDGQISQYFDIQSVSVSNGKYGSVKYANGTVDKSGLEGLEGVEANHATLDVTVDGENNITVTGADITPDDEGYEDTDNYCQIDIKIKAKDDFFGGNRVPILAGLTTADAHNTKDVNFKFTTAKTVYDYDYDDPLTGEHVTGSKDFDPMTFHYAGSKAANSHLEDDPNYYEYRDWCDYVNVDINLEASGNSYSYSTKTLPDSIPLDALYNDNFADYRGNESNYPNSEYLKTIGEKYRVFERDADNQFVLGAEVTAPLALPKVAGRYMYTVGYFVSPLVDKADAAIVGPVVENDTLISDVAIIIVLEAGTIIIGDKDGDGDRTTLNVDKLLSYDSTTGLYKLSVILNGHNEFEANEKYGYYEYRDDGTYGSQVTEYGNSTHRYTVLVSGWYAIGARGGQGGDGHGSSRSTSTSVNWGGFGAFGDDVTGYVWLDAGDELVWDLGNSHIEWYAGHNDGRNCQGEDGRTGTNGDRGRGRGGLGGEASWIALRKQGTGTNYIPLIIAAGGSGGAGSQKDLTNERQGKSNTKWDASVWGAEAHTHEGIAGIDFDTSIHTDGIMHYNGGKGESAGGERRDFEAGVQPNSFINKAYVVQTLSSATAATVNGDYNIATELPTPFFMDKADNIRGTKFPSVCNGDADEQYKVAGMMISLVYADKEGVLVGTNWDANNNLTSNVDVNKYYTVQGGYWTAATRGGNNTGLVANSASTKGFYDDLEFAIEFDKYFELDSFVLDGNIITSDAFGSGAGLDTNTYTVSQAHGDKTSVKFTNINYDGSSYAYITPGNDRFSNTVNFEANLEDLTFDFYLKPAENFVGGNDVPLLLLLGSDLCDANPGTDDHGSDYAGIGITIPNDPYKPGVTRYVEEKDESDYANVAINHTFDPEKFVTAQGLVIECGKEITDIGELLLVDEIAAKDNWYWDYAKAVTAHEVYEKGASINGEIYKQSAFTFQQQVAPKTETAEKAVVIDSVSPATCDNVVTVSVERPVEEKLTYITSEYLTSFDGFVAVTDDDGNVTGYKAKTEADVSGKLTADKGYVLPDSIKVTVCGIELTDFEYDSSTGMFTIHASDVIALLDAHADDHANVPASDHKIVIEAVATAETFELSFVWWDENGAESSDFDKFIKYIEELAGEPIENLVPGIDIPKDNAHKFVTGYDFVNGVDPDGKPDVNGNEWFEAFKALDHIDLPDHKEFKWIWGTDDEQALQKMPGVNAKIPGYVTDKTYYVTVHYVDQDDETKTDLIESTQVFGRYGSSEIVIAPEITGWIPVEASKIVTITEDDSGNVITDVYMEYVKAQGHLIVYHIKADTGEQIAVDAPVEITYDNIGSYNLPVTVRDVAHYTPKYDGAEVGGSISVEITSEDVDNGKAVYIYYYPDQYTVKFDGNSDNTTDDVVFKATDKKEKKVEYNNSFGYDADEGKFTQFPQPERKGYTFLGWFSTRDGGDEIIESVMITDLTVEGVKTYPAPAEAGGEIILYAHWEPAKFSVIVNYTVLDKDNNPIEFGSTYWPAELPDSRVVTPVEYTEDYAIDIPNPVGFLRTDISRADGLTEIKYSDDGTQIIGTMLLSDDIYNITYKQQEYELTIKLAWDPLLADDPDLPVEFSAEPVKRANLVYNEVYSYTLAELEGDLHDALAEYEAYVIVDGQQVTLEDVLSGNMPASNTEITVYYTISESVDIGIDDFEFKLSEIDYDAASHNYIGHQLDKIDGKEYNISVTVDSKKGKTVSFEYVPENEYKDVLVGSFNSNDGTYTYPAPALNNNPVQTPFDLRISGTGVVVTEDVMNSKKFKSGTVTVTVGDSNTNQGNTQEGVEEP